MRARSALVLAALSLAGLGTRAAVGFPQPAPIRAAPTGPASRAGDGVPRFDHVVLIVLENQPRGRVLGSAAAPYFNRLSRRYATLTRYVAVAHPSLPNYLALVSGSTHGIRSDCLDCLFRARSIADTLRARHDGWRAYVENPPHAIGDVDVRSLKARIPFLFFADVLSRRALLRSEIVPLARLTADLRARRLPAFSLVVPSLCHAMHDCPVRSGDAWLRSFLPPLLASRAARRTAVFVVFDESRPQDVVGGGGAVASLVLGRLDRPGARATARLDHYSLLRTIEDGLGLPRLGRSNDARPITGIWRAAPVSR